MRREGGYGGVTLVQAENKLGTLYHIQGATVERVCGMCVGVCAQNRPLYGTVYNSITILIL